ncbi:hypothetical protein OG884_11010 [Streptosporangium sp. NBC_01755]|uniref:hypothetical protein n=1 Tax=Streptosporangium sp. NBC_01755 TaxID=2975949 RepID=UPI002DDC6078|nr:hypothetical protein [Streptosporangium sp. NBC_01755]WSD02404.1 hypothetical protein OG884_11010 [Streptosporangium sp. NBC_01755]
MTVWWRGTRIVSAVGAGVLILGGASGVYAAQMAEPAELPLDLAAADPGTWSRWSHADEAIRFRIRLRGPGAGARLAVVTTPADALRSIECPAATRPATPLPKGTAVCAVGDLPAEGGLVDVLLAVPERPRDVTLTAMARMRGPGGETVQQGQGTLRGSDVVTRQVRGAVESPDVVTRQFRGAVGSPDVVTRQVLGAVESPETPELARAEREVGPALPGSALSGPVSGVNTGTSHGASGAPGAPGVPGVPGVSGPSRIYLADAPLSLPADPHPGVETLGAADLVLDAPRTIGERGWVPKVAPGASKVEKVEQRTLAFLFDVLERSSVPEAPRSVVAGTGTGAGTGGGSGASAGAGVDGSAAVPSAPVAPAVPVRPGTRLPAGAAASGVVPGTRSPAGAAASGVVPGTRPSADAAVPDVVPETSGGVSGHDPAAAVPKPARIPGEHVLQGQNGRNRPVMGSHTGRGAAGRKVSGKQRAACRSGARRQGAGRSTLGPMGPGYPGGGQQVIGKSGARRPMVVPMGPGYPGAAQWPAGQLVQPGQGVPGRLVQPGQGVPGRLAQPGQLGARPRGMGQPMLPGYPGAGPQGMPGGPGGPQRGAGRPAGGPVGPGYPGTGFPGAGQQVPVGQLPGGQAPMVPPQVPPPMGQVPGGQVPQVPPTSMGMAGAGQLPGLGNGLQFQLPSAGSFPAAAQVPVPQDPRPQGAPLPQDLDGPNTQVQPVAESSPLLTEVRGLPAVGAGVGALLGLLWLQRRIQRRRRSRHVL